MPCNHHILDMTKKLDTAEVAADKAAAVREYYRAQQAVADRTATLRAARLARENEPAPPPAPKRVAKRKVATAARQPRKPVART